MEYNLCSIVAMKTLSSEISHQFYWKAHAFLNNDNIQSAWKFVVILQDW